MWTPALPEAAETVAWDTGNGGLGVGDPSQLAEHLVSWHLEASPLQQTKKLLSSLPPTLEPRKPRVLPRLSKVISRSGL